MNVTEKNASDAPLQSEQKPKREKSTLCKVLPTDRIAFERQVEILRAYAACFESNGGKPVSNTQAGETLSPKKFSASTLGVAVPFFTDISLIARKEGDTFVPSTELVAYNQAFALSPPEAKRIIRPLFDKTWFCRLLTPRLRLSPQLEKDCVGLLAIEAKAEKEHLERVQLLIRFLEFAGIVAINSGTVSFVPLSRDSAETPLPASPGNGGGIVNPPDGTDQHTLYLSSDKKRVVTFAAPLTISNAEYDRVCNWIKATWIIEEKTQ